MSKNIALIALLLPFSGQAITKEERIDEMNREAKVHIWNGLHDLIYVICTYKILDLSQLPEEKRAWFLKQMEDLRMKIKELDKEYLELEAQP
jgi:hypothetical protein